MDYTLCILVSLSCVLLVSSLPQYGNEHHQGGELEYHQPQHEVHEPQHEHIQHAQPKHIHIPILAQKSETYKGGYQFSYKTGNGIYQEETGYLKKVPVDKDHHDKHGEHEEEAIVMQGKVTYTGADGKPYTLTYVADENGFHPQGDHLPTPPPIPHDVPGHGDAHQVEEHHQLEGHHQLQPQVESHHEVNLHQGGHGDLKNAQEYEDGYGHYGYH